MMRRREFLGAVPSLAMAGNLAPASRPRLKITDVAVVPLRRVKEVGRIEPAWSPG